MKKCIMIDSKALQKTAKYSWDREIENEVRTFEYWRRCKTSCIDQKTKTRKVKVININKVKDTESS